MAKALYIVRWGEWAEVPFKKRGQRLLRQTPLEWYRAPVHPGDSRTRLRAECHTEIELWAAIGVFEQICQLTAAQPTARRGWLLSQRGMPLKPEQVAVLIDAGDIKTATRLIGLLIKAEWIIEAEPSREWGGAWHTPPLGQASTIGEAEADADAEQNAPPASTNGEATAVPRRVRGSPQHSHGSAPHSHSHSQAQAHSPPNPPPPECEPREAGVGGGGVAARPDSAKHAAPAVGLPTRPTESPECREIRTLLNRAGVSPGGIRRILAIETVTPRTVADWIAHCAQVGWKAGALVEAICSGEMPPLVATGPAAAEVTRKRLADADAEWRAEVTQLVGSVPDEERDQQLRDAAMEIYGAPSELWPPTWRTEWRVWERAAKAIRKALLASRTEPRTLNPVPAGAT